MAKSYLLNSLKSPNGSHVKTFLAPNRAWGRICFFKRERWKSFNNKKVFFLISDGGMNWFTNFLPNNAEETENKESFLAWKEHGRSKGGKRSYINDVTPLRGRDNGFVAKLCKPLGVCRGRTRKCPGLLTPGWPNYIFRDFSCFLN